MPLEALQRPDWYGSPVDLGELFVLHKNGREAVCKLVSHQFGWECRLFIGQQSGIVQTQVCRSEEEVFSTSEQWKEKMAKKGWS